MLFNIAHFNALVAFLAALSLPSASAHPLDRDDNPSVSLERATNVSARADDEPPGYSEIGEELPGYSEEPSEGSPPEYIVGAGPGLQVVRSIKIDEKKMTAVVNKGKVYRLAANPAELGVPDRNALHRKYYMIDDTPESGEEPIKVAVIKIVDLLKANKIDKSVPKILQEEGYFWGKFRYYMWDKTIKHTDKHKKLVKWEYHVAYLALRNGLDLNDVQETDDGEREPVLRELMYLHEWAIAQQWTSANVKSRLAKCKSTAIKTHETIAARGFGITNLSPKVWLTDADCSVWVPNQMDPSYKYVNPRTGSEIKVRGAKKLKDNKAKNKYLTDVKHRLKEEVFKVSALQEQGYTYVTMEHDIAEGNLDHYT